MKEDESKQQAVTQTTDKEKEGQLNNADETNAKDNTGEEKDTSDYVEIELGLGIDE